MPHRTTTFLAVLLLAVGLVAWLLLHSKQPDPAFQGKSLGWLGDTNAANSGLRHAIAGVGGLENIHRLCSDTRY